MPLPLQVKLLHISQEVLREAFAYCGFTRNAMCTLLVNHGMLKARARP